ncbi:hypothetical protein BBG13_04610 [Actinomyces oris]|nr:hypothetical protein BBG13_04610 [Actinomyces oris]
MRSIKRVSALLGFRMCEHFSLKTLSLGHFFTKGSYNLFEVLDGVQRRPFLFRLIVSIVG